MAHRMLSTVRSKAMKRIVSKVSILTVHLKAFDQTTGKTQYTRVSVG